MSAVKASSGFPSKPPPYSVLTLCTSPVSAQSVASDAFQEPPPVPVVSPESVKSQIPIVSSIVIELAPSRYSAFRASFRPTASTVTRTVSRSATLCVNGLASPSHVNAAGWDRSIRLVVGSALLAASVTRLRGPARLAAVAVGSILVGVGVSGYCPIYPFLGDGSGTLKKSLLSDVANGSNAAPDTDPGTPVSHS